MVKGAMKSAAIIIIGNEILSGRIDDLNSPYLARELRGLGVEVRRIEVIPDEVDAIAAAVSDAARHHDFVFTSGGVGPTHDDVTMAGVAQAFGQKTVPHEGLLAVISRRCGEHMNEAAAKMALLPEGAEVIDLKGQRFPCVMLKNVYIFPGIPSLLVKKFEALRERFRTAPFASRKLCLEVDECMIAAELQEVVQAYPDVMIGSYPRSEGYSVVITLESRSEESVSSAYEKLMALLPQGSVVRAE